METSRRGLKAETVENVLTYVNPTHSLMNCVECAMAVDDSLGGRAAVAGPTPDQPGENVRSALSHRTIDYHEDLAPNRIEVLLRHSGPGARGIVVGWKDDFRAHAFNVANLGGIVYWLDGQRDRMVQRDPYSYEALDLYRTSDGVAH